MPAGQGTPSTAAYRPTSLDFINLPNPIEPNQPQTGSQKHPLNGTPRLEKARLEPTTNQKLFRLILDSSAERPAKRQKPSDSNLLDLPKLPVRSAPKRQQIPPTLSGLHQPPPEARILPSISDEQPQVPPPRQQDPVSQQAFPKPTDKQAADLPDVIQKAQVPATSAPAEASVNVQKKRTKRNKWTDEETECLLKGVSKFGIGSWTKILNCPDYTFNNRTAIDLKDRFRVCCPENYKAGGPPTTIPLDSATPEGENHTYPKPKVSTKGPPSEKISTSKLRELGINKPFSKAARRSRHGYTAEEDEALMRGYNRATDLRDRFRTRYPEDYAKSVSTPRPGQASCETKPVQSANENPTTSDGEGLPDTLKVTAQPANLTISEIIDQEDIGFFKPPIAKKKSDLPSLFSLDDLFLGVPFGAEDGDSEHIVLDRGILDWAGKSTAPDQARSHGIDPLMTLKLPKPVASMTTSVTAAPFAAPPPNSAPALPSLSTLLPEMANSEQLELPSLMQWFDSVDNEAKNGGPTIPTLEELLSG